LSSAVVRARPEETPEPSRRTTPVLEETLPIERLLKRLKRSWFMHAVPGSLVGPEPLSWRAVRFLQEVLANFSDKRWQERTVAAWALGRNRIPPELEEEVTAALSEVLDNRDARLLIPSRTWRWIKRTYGIYLISVLACLMAFWLGDAFERFSLFEAAMVGSFLLAGIAALCSAPLVLPLGFWMDARYADSVRIAAATALGRLCRPESVGVLAKALFDRNRKVREAAESAFRVVLPTLTPEHYGRLGEDAVLHLCRALNYQEMQLHGFPADKERLVYHLLEALEKVGGGSAVQPVEEIAEYGQTTCIQEKARQILPILRERQRRENEPKVLLRATSMPADAPAQLLRPALSSEAGPPAQLLRPTTAQIQHIRRTGQD